MSFDILAVVCINLTVFCDVILSRWIDTVCTNILQATWSTERKKSENGQLEFLRTRTMKNTCGTILSCLEHTVWVHSIASVFRNRLECLMILEY